MGKITNIIERLIPDTRMALRRFPLAIFMAAALAVIFIIKLNNIKAISDETLFRLVSGITLAFFTTIMLTFIGEGRGGTTPISVKVISVVAVLFAGFFFQHLSFLPPMAIGALVLFLGTAPFWHNNHDDAVVWNFTNRVWTGVVFAIAGGIIYSLGVFAIAGALDTLFSIRLYDLVQEWLLPIGLLFLVPTAWLTMLPRYGGDGVRGLDKTVSISRESAALGIWVLAPLTIIYAIILLAYGLKIALIGALPNGEIAMLVTPFLFVGTLTWLVLDPSLIKGKRLAHWYSRSWFWFMTPATILLSVAVYIRIGEHGWTIPRYLLVLVSIWALGISAWFLVKGDKHRDFRIIPAFAALLLLFGSIGPWGADGFSMQNQKRRLEHALIANDMLVAGGHELKPISDLKLKNVEAAARGRGALSYLLKHDIKAVNYFLPAGESYVSASIFYGLSYEDNKKAVIRFGLNDVRTSNGTTNQPSMKRFYSANKSIFPVGKYEYFTARKNQNLNSTEPSIVKFSDFVIMLDNKHMIVMRGGEEVSRVSVVTWLRSLNLTSASDGKPISNLVLYSEGNIEIAMHLNSADYYVTNTSQEFSWINYFFFIKGIDPDD